MGPGVSPLFETVEDALDRDLISVHDILDDIGMPPEGDEEFTHALHGVSGGRSSFRKLVERLNRRQDRSPGPAGGGRTARGDESGQTRSVSLGVGRNEDADRQALFARTSSIWRSSSAM